MPIGILQAVLIQTGIVLVFLIIALVYVHRHRPSCATRIVLALPITVRNGVTMPNLEIPISSTEYVPLQTKDADGNIVSPPAGDVFTPTSSDPSITPSMSTMPSGPLQGALAVALATGTVEAQNVTIAVTDADGLQQAQQVCDVVGGAAQSIFLDAVDAVNVPDASGSAKKA